MIHNQRPRIELGSSGLGCASYLRNFMFLTTDANKHPLSTIYGKGKHLWTGIDVQIRRPWLLVDFQLTLRDEDGDEVTCTNTVLLSGSEDILGLAAQNVRILTVQLVTPHHNFRSGGWAIDRLTGIWECDDPADVRIKAKVYAKEDGSNHLDSLFGGAIDHADGWKLLLDLPACVADDEGGVNEFR